MSRNITLEQIFLLIIFILLPFLNFVVQRVRQRRQTEPPQLPSVPEVRRRAQASAPRAPAPQPSPERLGGRETPPVLTLTPHSHFAKGSLFRTKADLRRGIILMTILGPCRAVEPPE